LGCYIKASRLPGSRLAGLKKTDPANAVTTAAEQPEDKYVADSEGGSGLDSGADTDTPPRQVKIYVLETDPPMRVLRAPGSRRLRS
jgi:hypothetical protein